MVTTEQDLNKIYQDNLKFWDAAWKRVSKPHKELPKLPYIHEITRKLKKYQVKRVLDLGCGSGRNANYLAQNGFKVFGYDWSQEAIEQAKQENYPERLLEGSAVFNVKDLMTNDWGFMKYDIVIDFGYFHFFAPELRPHYHEQLKKVLKSGGIYINESGRYKKWKSNPLKYIPPYLEKEVWKEFDYLNIEKLEENMIPPHNNYGEYPCWNVFARKL